MMKKILFTCSFFAIVAILSPVMVIADDASDVTNDIIHDDYQIDKLNKQIKILELQTKLEKQKRKLEEARHPEMVKPDVAEGEQIQPSSLPTSMSPVPVMPNPATMQQQSGNTSGKYTDPTTEYELSIFSGEISAKKIVQSRDKSYAVLSMNMNGKSSIIRVENGDFIGPGVRVVEIDDTKVKVKIKKGNKYKYMNIWMSGGHNDQKNMMFGQQGGSQQNMFPPQL